MGRKDLWQQPCRAKMTARTGARKQEIASQKIPNSVHGCFVESHESTKQRVESSLLTKHDCRIVGKGFHFDTSLQFCSQIYPAMKILYATAAADMEKARDNSCMATGESQEQERCYS